MTLIREFITLAETLSFSRTAELTYVSQPVLSRHITKLEEKLGCRLLVRNTRRVELTEEGQLCYESFCRIEQEYRQLLRQLSARKQSKEGQLKLAVVDYFLEEFVEPHIEYYQSEHPHVSISIVSTSPVECFLKLDAEAVDVVVSPSVPLLGQGYKKTPYAKDPMALIFRRDHPFAEREHITLEDVNNEDVIMLGGENVYLNACKTWILDTLETHSVYPHSQTFCPNADLLFYKIRTTNSIGIVPFSLRHSDRSYAVIKALPESDFCMDLCIFYNPHNQNPLIPGFVKAVLEREKESQKQKNAEQ